MWILALIEGHEPVQLRRQNSTSLMVILVAYTALVALFLYMYILRTVNGKVSTTLALDRGPKVV